GEVRVRGGRRDGQPWQIGIERPVAQARELQYIVGLSDQALATSGDYRNAFELEGRHFAHTIDPRSGWPVEYPLASVSAVAESCELADAIATSVMASGAERGLELAERQGWAVLLILGESEGYASRCSTAF